MVIWDFRQISNCSLQKTKQTHEHYHFLTVVTKHFSYFLICLQKNSKSHSYWCYAASLLCGINDSATSPSSGADWHTYICGKIYSQLDSKISLQVTAGSNAAEHEIFTWKFFSTAIKNDCCNWAEKKHGMMTDYL